MPTTVNVNMLTAVHKGSNGMAVASVPDVCLTPMPTGPPVPIPYPNMAMSQNLVAGTTSVKTDGMSAAIKGCQFTPSTGDEPGTAGGVVSGVNKGPAEFIMYSFDVKMEGKNACRLTDQMKMNRGNTLCAAELQAPLVIVPEPTDWVEVKLVDSEGNPVPDVRFELQLSDGSQREGRLDFRGRKKVTGIIPGTCQVRFPDLPDSTWEPQ